MADTRERGGRALLRAALTLTFVTTFVAAVALLTVEVSRALGAGTRPPVLGILLAATLATVALPRVRSSAERLANWIVLRDRADSYGLVAEFVRNSVSTLPIEEVLPRLAETAARSVRSPRGEVRVWLADGGEWREAWSADRRGEGPGLNVDVRHDGQAVGELEVGIPSEELDASSARRRLAVLAGPAGLALSTVRLTVDLRRRLEELARTESELRASAGRLVEARLEERQRFADTIDKFVQPHLTAATIALGEAACAGADKVESYLTDAARHGEAALERLRSLAHGVFPIVLLQAGLAEALEVWGDEADVVVSVHGTDDPAFARRNPTVAAAEFFVCIEAIQALRPPPANATIALSQEGGAATLELDWAAGTTLDADTTVGLRDRTEAVGGTLAFVPAGLRIRIPTEVGR